NSSSPYFLNSSINVGPILVSCILKGENYPIRHRAKMNELRAKNKLCFLDGSLPKPAKTWEKCNSMTSIWIFNALVPESHDIVANVDTTSEMWTDLQECFSQGNAP
ncbi:UBN2_3 domain-containing protein, partial [Cephalotus follicularis]